jgi:hypothetical protein
MPPLTENHRKTDTEPLKPNSAFLLGGYIALHAEVLSSENIDFPEKNIVILGTSVPVLFSVDDSKQGLKRVFS